MYFWKCWRDTRSFFVVFLIIAAIVMPVAAMVCLGTHLVADFGASAFSATFGLILMPVALGLGAIGAIHEFAENTAHFLFTKPRSRSYFVWAGWAVGFAELLAVATVNFVAGWLTLSRYSKNPFHSALFGPMPAHTLLDPLIFCLWAYCLTYSLTILLHNGLKGLGASMGVLFGFPLFAVAIRWRWHIDLPFPPNSIGSLPLAISSIIWILVAMLFVLARSLSLNAPKYDLATQGNLKYRVYCARQVPRKPFLRGEKGKTWAYSRQNRVGQKRGSRRSQREQCAPYHPFPRTGLLARNNFRSSSFKSDPKL